MKFRQGIQEKSRLGRLLINRGYLSESQLEEGLRLQRETGQRLGEVLIQAGWLTEKELHRVLKHQSRYRNAAAFVTMVALPFQPVVSFAATSQTAHAKATETGEMINSTKFQAMSDEDMGNVAGQGEIAILDQIASVGSMPAAARGEGDPEASDPDSIEALKLATNVFVPVLNFLDSDLTISGVHYREGAPRFTVETDGALNLAMPERIEQIKMANIRVQGGGVPMGTITISDVRFHAGSSMTIRSR